MKNLRRPSIRQLMLPLECETTIRLAKEVHQEAISALADLLLEALGVALVEPTEEGDALSECEN